MRAQIRLNVDEEGYIGNENLELVRILLDHVL